MCKLFNRPNYLRGYDDGFATLSPVMSFKPNKLGIYDLAGNTWEWCDGWSSEKHDNRVLRGGAWETVNLLSSFRWAVPANRSSTSFGFRCVVVKDKQDQPQDDSSEVKP
jgi:formylglycine-generating enzyme required for sulfatase activity